MANADTPFGLKPIRKLGSTPNSGGVTRYYRGTGDANNVFIGDLVQLGGTGNTAGDAANVVRATAAGGNYMVGVVVGIENNTSDNLSRTYLPASTEGYLLVADDPDEEFEIQEDSVGGALANTNISQNADFIQGTGSTVTGISAVELDSSTADTTNTLQLKILGLVPRADNEIGTNAKWRVKINLHALRNLTGV
jgi:hypothetical protein